MVGLGTGTLAAYTREAVLDWLAVGLDPESLGSLVPQPGLVRFDCGDPPLLTRGKKLFDKRRSIAERDAKRDTDRAMKAARR